MLPVLYRAKDGRVPLHGQGRELPDAQLRLPRPWWVQRYEDGGKNHKIVPDMILAGYPVTLNTAHILAGDERNFRL